MWIFQGKIHWPAADAAHGLCSVNFLFITFKCQTVRTILIGSIPIVTRADHPHFLPKTGITKARAGWTQAEKYLEISEKYEKNA